VRSERLSTSKATASPIPTGKTSAEPAAATASSSSALLCLGPGARVPPLEDGTEALRSIGGIEHSAFFLAEGPHVYVGRLMTEGRQTGTDLTPMVGSVVGRLREPDAGGMNRYQASAPTVCLAVSRIEP
jgi:hypothetical protein